MSYEILSAELYSEALGHHFNLFLLGLCGIIGVYIYNSWVKVICVFVESPTRLCVNYWGIALLAGLWSFVVSTSLLTAAITMTA